METDTIKAPVLDTIICGLDIDDEEDDEPGHHESFKRGTRKVMR